MSIAYAQTSDAEIVATHGAGFLREFAAFLSEPNSWTAIVVVIVLVFIWRHSPQIVGAFSSWWAGWTRNQDLMRQTNEARLHEAEARARAAEADADAARNTVIADLQQRLARAEAKAEDFGRRHDEASTRERECLNVQYQLAGKLTAMETLFVSLRTENNDQAASISAMRIQIEEFQRRERMRGSS